MLDAINKPLSPKRFRTNRIRSLVIICVNFIIAEFLTMLDLVSEEVNMYFAGIFCASTSLIMRKIKTLWKEENKWRLSLWTLLHILAGLDNPTAGRYIFKARNVTNMNDDQKCILRNTEIAIILQQFGLIGSETVMNNFCLSKLSAARVTAAIQRLMQKKSFRNLVSWVFGTNQSISFLVYKNRECNRKSITYGCTPLTAGWTHSSSWFREHRRTCWSSVWA